MRKESAIIRKCSAQRTGEPFHYASIQHILSNVMNAGILRSGETKSEVFPELQIVSLEQFNRVAKTREQRSVNYAIKCGGTTETVQLEDGTEATVVRPPRAYPRKIVGKALLSGNVYCGHCGGRIFAATARKTHRPTESNERIAIYKCYNRSQHKGQCDGPSTYRAEKVDKVIEQLLRGIFERAKKVDEKTILKMLVDASAEQCQQELKAAKLEYTKAMKELSRWGDLMLDSLDGTCVFTPEQVKARLDDVQAKADEIAYQIQQLEEKSRQMKPAAADLLREHQQILT
ncbi:MAG: zinc ribbon domain-containing protein, partial [Neglectibacter sp.]